MGLGGDVSGIGEPGGELRSDGEEEEDAMAFSGCSDVEVGNWGSGTEPVLSGMVSNVERTGCHVEGTSLLQSEVSVTLGSSQ